MKKKKALFLIGIPGFSLSNANSAVAKYIVTLIDALRDKDYEVTFIPAGSSDASHSTPTPGSSNSLAARIRKAVKSMLPYLYYSMVDYRYLKKQEGIYSQALRHAADADIIIEFLTYGSRIGAMLKQRTGKPLAVIWDSPLKEQYLEMYGSGSMFTNVIESAEKLSVKTADLIICYSDAVKLHLAKTVQPEGRIEVLPCIVWKNDVIASPSAGGQVIGFIGSFLKWHKVDLLVKAFGETGRSFPEAKLVLVGYGQEWPAVKAMVDAHPFKDRIILTGFVSEEELREWKKMFTVGVMPGSNWYGSPLKLFEYAEARIPFIAPSTPTVCSLFEKDTEALFIDSGNELKSLAAQLHRMLSDEKLRAELADRAFKKMKDDFARERQMSIFTGIITETLQSGVKR
jgi:glycosyltransferase involved in cell wall biosynthesis